MASKLATKFFKRFHSIGSQFGRDIAIDLGTANTVIYAKGSGIVLNQPSMVAVIYENGFEVPYLFGAEAKLMLGKTPNKIAVHRPLQDGVIADFKVAEEMIKHFIGLVNPNNKIIKPLIIICVPFNSTAVERRAIQEAVEKSGAKEVFLIEEPMAAAIGACLPVGEPRGSMIVDIGGGTADVAIISLGGVVHGKSIKIGGNAMDSMTMQYVKQKYNLFIGESMAESIKREIGCAYLKPDQENKVSSIRGRDLITGTPKEVSITQQDMAQALSESVVQIVDAVRLTLETAPPELAADMVDSGIVLTGGGALLENLDYVIRESTGLPVFIAPDPLLCVVKGVGKVLEKYKEYAHVLFKQV